MKGRKYILYLSFCCLIPVNPRKFSWNTKYNVLYIDNPVSHVYTHTITLTYWYLKICLSEEIGLVLFKCIVILEIRLQGEDKGSVKKFHLRSFLICLWIKTPIIVLKHNRTCFV